MIFMSCGKLAVDLGSDVLANQKAYGSCVEFNPCRFKGFRVGTQNGATFKMGRKKNTLELTCHIQGSREDSSVAHEPVGEYSLLCYENNVSSKRAFLQALLYTYPIYEI